MASSTKPRNTNSTPPSIAPHPASTPNLVSTAPTSSSPTLQSTLNTPRPSVKKLVPSDALGPYLTSEDRRDRSFMAILAAFSTVDNQALCVKELVDVIRDNQLLNLGGATPSGTINSAIRNHINRCVDRQLPCFLSRHVLSGDASDERLSPSIGVKPHHRRSTPPIVRSEPSSSETPPTKPAPHASTSLIGTASVSCLGGADAAASSLAPTSPCSFSTSPTSPIPSSSASFTPPVAQLLPQSQPHSRLPAQQTPPKEKIYLKNKNGRTRKGVCLWFLSSWTGFQNPFIREGFHDIGFLTDGKAVPEGETYLVSSDFEFRWSLAGSGTPPSIPSPPIAGSGNGFPKTEIVSGRPPPLGVKGAPSFFTDETPVPSLGLTVNGAATPAPMKPHISSSCATSAISLASRTKVKLQDTSSDICTAVPSPADGVIRNRHGNGSTGGSRMRFLTPLQLPGISGVGARAGSTAADNGNGRRQKQYRHQAKKVGDPDCVNKGDPSQPPVQLYPLSSPPTSPTVDVASSDVEMNYSSDDAMSGSSDESDAAAESDSEEGQSEVATTVDADEDFPRFGNWGYDDDVEDDDDDDEDRTLLITPRSSIVDGSPPSPWIHVPFAAPIDSSPAANLKPAVHDIRPFGGWGDFPATSVAMTMELSAGLMAGTSPPLAVKDVMSQVVPSVRPIALPLLSIPHSLHERDAISHDELGSPFTPLSSAMSSRRASPSHSSHPDAHRHVLDEFHMDLDVGLSAQNGDARRAAEDDILIDELLDGPEGAFLHEFEEAWGDGGTVAANEQEDCLESTYLTSPEPSEMAAPSFTVTRSASPIAVTPSLRQNTHLCPFAPRSIADQDKHGSGADTPGRTYCPGICVPMHRPASREGAYDEFRGATTLIYPDAAVTLPSTPPRTPSPSLRGEIQTPEAELDALIVPGAAVSESPTPAALLLPADDELAVNYTATSKDEQGLSITAYQVQSDAPPPPLHMGHQQLGQIMINTIRPSDPPVCATFVDGIFVYTLFDPYTGQRLLRAVDTDYVHLSSLITISRPPLRPRDACRIISLCHSPLIIMPSTSLAAPGIFTPLAGSWVPLEDVRRLCDTGELSIPHAVGQLFLDRNLGEQYFPEPLPEWCRARHNLRESGAALCNAMSGGGNLAAPNANASAMAALAELARMGGVGASAPALPSPDMTHQLGTPRRPTPQLAAPRHASPVQQEDQQGRSDNATAMVPLSPALSAPSLLSSHVTANSPSNPPSLVRSLSATSVSSDSSVLSSPPTTPPPEVAPVLSESTEHAELARRRGPGRPRKPRRGAGATPFDDKKHRARNVAIAAPMTSRTERATARTLRSASRH